MPFGVKKARFTQERSKTINKSDNHNPTPPHHSLAYTKVQEGGQGFASVGPRGRIQRQEVAAHVQRAAPLQRHFSAPGEERNRVNNKLSNNQANWLWDRKLCLHCFCDFHKCSMDGKVCPSKGKDVRLPKGEGFPTNKFN